MSAKREREEAAAAEVFSLRSVTRPTLLLSETIMKANVRRMVDRAKKLGVELIPHFKTHQSRKIGRLIKDMGIRHIQVASVQMAEYFAGDCRENDDVIWDKITIAFPFNPLEIQALNAILKKGVEVTVLVTELSTVRKLSERVYYSEEKLLNVMIELDCGDGRSGVCPSDTDTLRQLANEVTKSKALNLYGLYCHPGHTYAASSHEVIKDIWSKTREQMLSVKKELTSSNAGADLKIRMGDTPGCSVVEDLTGVNEISAGNFVFFDLMMARNTKVCKDEDVAVCVACPVVQKKEQECKVIIHGGAVHFSKDSMMFTPADGKPPERYFGELVFLSEDGSWSKPCPRKDVRLQSISQEHGILRVFDKEVLKRIEIGDVVGILPIHSCLTADAMKMYHTIATRKKYKHAQYDSYA